eukprot:TRINITY_DN2319_c0_g1_i1.p1 TRINITY_DN2319_c0_g1~~TRINITY_DN2319_c0_g1_i1.p1  ORF type:complete len:280 (+),score=46.34 TRINITY_DN2319_c0_g1_i1:61-900(+)
MTIPNLGMIAAVRERFRRTPRETESDERLNAMVRETLKRIKNQTVPKVPLSMIARSDDFYEPKRIFTKKPTVQTAAVKVAAPATKKKVVAPVVKAVPPTPMAAPKIPKKREEQPEDNRLWTHDELFLVSDTADERCSICSKLPYTVIFEVLGYLTGPEMVQFVASAESLPDDFWNVARVTTYSDRGEDIPWPFQSAYEYFRFICVSMVFPTAMNICMYEAPWPICASTCQPFGQFLTPVNPDNLPRDVSREMVDANVEEFRATFPKRFDEAMKQAARSK